MAMVTRSFDLIRRYTVMGYYTSRDRAQGTGLSRIAILQRVARLPAHRRSGTSPSSRTQSLTMPKQIYDVIVIGTGAGGGMAIHTLARPARRSARSTPAAASTRSKDFRNHRQAL